MFEQITTLFSFIFAIALTHVFSSASGLILARSRVRFHSLQALWMLSASFGLLINWLSLAELSKLKFWSGAEILLQLSWAVPQYFTCSLISLSAHGEGQVDMQAFFERQRPVLFTAFILLYAGSMIENFVDRNNYVNWKPGDWIGADLVVLPMLVAAVIAGWAKPMWLQWAAVIVTLALQCWFLASFVVPT